MKRIYLDNAAATPMDREVLDAMMPYLTTSYGNPSSLHYFGQQARAAVQKARGQVAHCLGVSGEDLVFTSGGTEADNLAVLGYLRANFPKGGHVITTAVEHHAVLRTFQALEEKGYDVTYVPVNGDGCVSADDVEAAMRDDTALISVMYANNETGMIQPIAAIGALAKEKALPFMSMPFRPSAICPFGLWKKISTCSPSAAIRFMALRASVPCISATDSR